MIRNNRLVLHRLVLMLALASFPASAQDSYPPAQIPIGEQSTDASRYNVTWTSMSTTGSSGAMPLGNGDIALNAWVESGGDLVFLIAKTDAFDDSARLCKVGRVRVRFTPNPFTDSPAFQQTLDIERGEMRVSGGPADAPVTVKLWVDANQPVIHVETTHPTTTRVEAKLEILRPTTRDFTSHLQFSDINKNRSGGTLYSYPDTVATGPASTVVWYHHNTQSLWQDAMTLQLIPDAESLGFVDPYLNRVFGGWIEGEGFTNTSPTTLVSAPGSGTNSLAIHVLTDKNSSPSAWQAHIQANRDAAAAVPLATAYTNHLAWWNQFWQRSWIHVGSADTGENNSAWKAAFGYTLQRYINACAGRGAYPIKFNGSLFTVEYNGDVDFRQWGPGYWLQNTRHMYWSMLNAGDFDLMQPFFKLYSDTLDIRRRITNRWFGHGGSYIPELMNIHGLADCDTYGWQIDHSGANSVLRNDFYLAYYYAPMIELGWMMFDYADYTGDTDFLVQQALPLIDDGVRFYHEHFKVPRDANDRALGTNEVYQADGKYIMYPANACETWWSCTNPAPDVVGWRVLMNRVLALDPSYSTAEQRAYWQNFNNRLPDVPMRSVTGGQALGFAQTVGPNRNAENPELYAVFPFRMYGLGKPDLDIAIRTYHNRLNKGYICWSSDPIDAALLGITSDAKARILQNYSQQGANQRFPAFWAKNMDWTPDEDNGGAANTALQRMLAQWDNGQVRLLPAWPQDWDVDFKMHGPNGATIHCVYKNGSIETLELSPSNLTVVMPSFLNPNAILTWNGTPGGNWDTSATNWLAGTTAVNWDNTVPNSAVFGATGAGTVNLTAAITANHLTFGNPGYNLAGNPLTLGGAPSRITTDADATISSVIAGSASIYKSGAGTLTIGGTNTFTGSLTVSGGSVASGTADPMGWQTAGSFGGSWTFNTGCKLNNGTVEYTASSSSTHAAVGVNDNSACPFHTTGNPGTIKVDTAGVTLYFGAYRPTQTNGSAIDNLVNDGGLIVTGAGNVDIRKHISGTGGLTMNGTGTWTIGPALSAATNRHNTYSGDTTINNGTLRLRGDYAAAAGQAIIPSGTGKGNVIVNSPGTLDLSTKSVTINGLSGTGTVTSSSAGSLTLTAGANDQTSTFSGIIQNGSGTVALTKTGAGTLTLNGSNTYAGATTVNGGTLNGTGAINGPTTVLSGGTLGAGTIAAIGTLTINNTLTLNAGGTVSMRVSKTGGVATNDVVSGMSGTLAYAGILKVTNTTADATPLADGDTFTLFIKGAGGYSGTFDTLDLPALPGGLIWDVSQLAVNGSIRVGMTGVTATTAPDFSPVAGGYIGAKSVTISCTTPGSTIHYSTDNWVTTHIYTGAIVVGVNTTVTIKAFATAAGYSPSVEVAASYTTMDPTIWSNPAGGSWSATSNWSNSIIGDGVNATADFNRLTLTANAMVTLDSSPTIGHLVFGDVGDSYNWTVNPGSPVGTLTLAGTNSPTITVNNRATNIAAVVAGSNGMTKAGTGTLTLSGVNTFTGGLTVNAGTVVATTKLAMSSGTITVNPGGLLSYTDAAYAHFPNTLNIIGGTVSLDGETQNAHNFFGGTLTMQGGTLTSVNGPAGPANDGGYGNLVLNGATLVVSGSAQSVIRCSTFQCANNGSSFNVGVTGAAVDLRVDSVLVNNGGIGMGTVLKSGAGTMALNGANTYTGATTVNNGTLLVNGSLASGSAVTVAGGATLGGIGTIGGTVTLQSGATLAAGASDAIGTLTINNTLALNAGATVRMRVSKTGGTVANDVIKTTGATALGGTLVVTDVTSDTSAPAVGDAFTLFNSGGGLSGSFTSVNLPLLPAGFDWDTSQLATNGRIVVVANNTIVAPTFTPPAGDYTGEQAVTLSCATPGATIYYTTDGSTPSNTSAVYSSPITVPVDTTLTIRAYAHVDGSPDSAVVSATYTTHTDPTPFCVASISAAADKLIGNGVMIYHFSTAEIPVSVLAADAPERWVYFGNPVPLTFTNAVPGAAYRIELVYSSDGTRVQTLSLNGSQLGLSFTLAAQSTSQLSRDCGIAGSDTLAFVIARTSGPNAVASSVKIYSSDPTLLTPPSTNINLAVPRLSPLPSTVVGVVNPMMDLNGTWGFQTSAPTGFPTNTNGTWSDIQVPGEWVMQGFTVATGTSTAYRRSFDLPPDWQGKRIKLRFDAVYSSCNVWVNGQVVGSHSDGFTPFEQDITSAVHAGTNSLELTVLNESEADTLASGSRYAAHQLGGISRKVTLFAAPSVNVSGLHVLPQVAADSLTASAEVRLAIANESTNAVSDVVALVELCPIMAGVIEPPVAQATVSLATLAAGGTISTTTLVAVPSPRLWHPEKPNLYIARVTLQQGGSPVGTTTRRFGLRRIEIIGNQVFVNGAPVKLAGVCRHEVHPLLGRSLTPEWWRLDAQRFVEMNANLVRTSHYPPAEEFIDLCDELGLFVEEEAPFCWANSSSGLIQTSTLEMVNRDLSHPSILFWSLANESTWGSAFANSSTALRQFDPSRPQAFNYWNPTLNSNAYVEIQSAHYPSTSAPAQWAANPQPISFGEYSHLYDYNRRELLTDPGLRDFWGPYHASMWESMWQSQAVLGGSIWAAIDDTFFMPQLDGSRIPVGYGGWGPIDGWRRQKPEYWHSKRAYSPLRLLTPDLPSGDTPVILQVENRHTMTALNELTVDYAWLDAAQTVNAGHLTDLLRLDSASCSGAPSATGSITLPTNSGLPTNRQLYIRLTSPRGFVIDEWLLRQADSGPVTPPATGAGTLTETAGEVTLVSGNSTWTVNKQTGLMTQMTASNGAGSQALATSGPFLMLLPSLNQPAGQLALTTPPIEPSTAVCGGWSNVSVTTTNGSNPSVRIQGTYSQASGAFTLTPTNGGLMVDYDFTLTQSLTPRQIGLVFELPGDCPNLAWQRDGELDIYPADHIGRPVGQAVATNGTPAGAHGPTSAPTLPWSLDLLPQGNNDFRSTKKNIRHVNLSNATGYGLQVLSDGSQASRAWLENGRTRLLVADFNNGGSPDFFSGQLPPPVTLSAGSHVSGQVFLAATTTPAVVLSDLVGGTLFGVAANIPLSVSVEANGHLIDRVRYYSGTTFLGEATAPPYSILWSAAAPGAHDITAVVHYAGGSTSSLPVSIRVLGMPDVTNTTMLAEGSFQLSFTGPPGQTFRVLATDTLSTPSEQWTVLATGTIEGSGSAAFTDTSATTQQRRFYRIASP